MTPHPMTMMTRNHAHNFVIALPIRSNVIARRPSSVITRHPILLVARPIGHRPRIAPRVTRRHGSLLMPRAE